MSKRPTKQIVVWLFIFIYSAFVYQHGVKQLLEPNIDFPAFYWGAKLAFVEHRSPYTVDAFAEAKVQIEQHIFPYLYPPQSLLVFYPLTFFRYGVAKAVMLIINHACILLFMYLFFFKITEINIEEKFYEFTIPLFIVYTLGFYPVVANLIHGQINQIVLLLLCLTWYAMKKQAGSWLIALPLSMAILMKTYPALFILLLIINKRYRAVLWVCALLLAYSIVAYLVLPHAVWTDWVTNVLPTGGYGQVPFNLFSPAEMRNHSINGFISRIFLKNEFSEALWPNPALARTLPYLLSFCVVAISIGVCYLASRSGHDAGRLIDLEFSVFLLLMIMVGPLSWESHLVFVLPPALIAISCLLARRRSYFLQLMVVLSLFVIAWDIPITYPALRKGVLTLAIAAKFYAVVVLWIYFVLQIHRFARGTQPAAQAQATPELLHAG